MSRPRLRLVEMPARRAPVAAALHQCSGDERAMLALVLIERMSTAEAAAAMRMPRQRFERSYTTLLASLRRAIAMTPDCGEEPLSLRKAS
jgi:DNA-directed RNA polymerase specialized sigma24 family protein